MKWFFISLALTFAISLSVFFFWRNYSIYRRVDEITTVQSPEAISSDISSITTPSLTPTPVSTFLYEAKNIQSSARNDWWVSSGALAEFSGTGIKTIVGDLSDSSQWKKIYADSNPTDTDGGIHPQNIFRLVHVGTWQKYRQQMYFRILNNNLSTSENRNESNGIFFFNHYVDEDNVYYTGLRVDGQIVIKRKYKGQYTTLAIEPVISGKYNRLTRPNLLQSNTWYGIRSDISTESDGVHISFSVDLDGSGTWEKSITYIDTHSPTVLREASDTGIRTDFMDVECRDYSITSL